MSGSGTCCPSPIAGGREDRCGLFAYPPRCTPANCTLVSGPTREQLAEALAEVASLLYEVWRGEVASPSERVAQAVERYAKHPSHLLAATDWPPQVDDASATDDARGCGP